MKIIQITVKLNLKNILIPRKAIMFWISSVLSFDSATLQNQRDRSRKYYFCVENSVVAVSSSNTYVILIQANRNIFFSVNYCAP